MARRLNFLETAGVVALALPVLSAAAVGVLLLTGTVRIYREKVPVTAR